MIWAMGGSNNKSRIGMNVGNARNTIRMAGMDTLWMGLMYGWRGDACSAAADCGVDVVRCGCPVATKRRDVTGIGAGWVAWVMRV